MRSTSRRLPEAAGSALEDSTYELLGDNSIDTSDDEAHTESIASTDGPTPDDSSSFSDDDDDYGGVDRELEDSLSYERAATPDQQHISQSLHSTDDSMLTEVLTYSDGSGKSRKIRLDERTGEEPGIIQSGKIIKSYPDETGVLPPVFARYRCSQLRLVVKAALSHETIPTPDSYKILYIGMPDKWLEDAITSQIGAALTAYPSTTRSVMVQGQLEPYGPIIHVYRCIDVRLTSKLDESSGVAFHLDDGRQLLCGGGQTASSDIRPDLVVFCQPTVPESVAYVQNYLVAHETLDREKMPYVDVAQARQYGHGSSAYNRRSLCVCVEGRSESTASSEFELQEVLPLDSYTFCDLDPSQLNRHLALISASSSSSGAAFNKRQRIGESWKTNIKKLQATWFAPAKVFLILVALTGMLSAYLLSPILMSSSFEKRLDSDANPFIPVTIPISKYNGPLTACAPMISSVHVPSIDSTPRDLTLVPPQVKPPKQKKRKHEEHTGFLIHPTAQHQFALSPLKEFSKSQKIAQLQIRVSRLAANVPIRYNRTVTGTYVVDLEQRYPYGAFNVTITTYSKPFLLQSFVINLGHNDSMLGQILYRAKQRTGIIQGKILNKSTIAAQGLLADLTSLEAKVQLWLQEARATGQDITTRVHHLQEQVEQQLKTGTACIKTYSCAAWSGLQRGTAPVRTSEVMLRARMNALRVRCRMETAAGRSSEDNEEKLSWACAKVKEW